MSRAKKVLAEADLVDGYEYTVDNAIRLFGAANELQVKFPDKALALAQLGQEEIGKSLTILAAFSLPSDPSAWTWFWDGWKSHALKAHRAYFYEIINPLRIELRAPDGSLYDGFPLREPISREKESGLYVDFDVAANRFTNPAAEVSSFEALARMSTLLYLSATADAVRRAMMVGDYVFRLKEFGTIAFKICSEATYQQEMPMILEGFRARSSLHDQIVTDLQIVFADVHATLEADGPRLKSYASPSGT
jgi:AbiV family abortive infection protein